MVSHLLSNRTYSTPYRYQRPNNTHTPASYTPYSYTPNTSTQNTTSASSNNDDDCCCESTASTSVSSSIASPSVATPSTSSTASAVVSTSTPAQVQTPLETRPRRPTTLALTRSMYESSPSIASVVEGTTKCFAAHFVEENKFSTYNLEGACI